MTRLQHGAAAADCSPANADGSKDVHRPTDLLVDERPPPSLDWTLPIVDSWGVDED
jgi:hypothetical protein